MYEVVRSEWFPFPAAEEKYSTIKETVLPTEVFNLTESVGKCEVVRQQKYGGVTLYAERIVFRFELEEDAVLCRLRIGDD